MSAELLRRAAKVLREYAEASSASPWTATTGGPETSVDNEEGHTILESHHCAEHPDRNGPDGAYAALMHPPVVLALASVFDRFAWLGARDPDLLRRVGSDEVIAVARAVLREEES